LIPPIFQPPFTATGYLYPIDGERLITVHCPSIASWRQKSLPYIDVRSVFTEYEGPIYKASVKVGRDRFILYGYLNEDGPSNSSIITAKDNLLFRGEVVIFQRGKFVSTLSRRSAKLQVLNRAVVK
jgi:hypothetical protein